MEHTVEITMSTWLSLLEDRRELISPPRVDDSGLRLELCS